jgi:1-acyl-sn-glycerol-3-phosphate acyltransferase
MLSLPVVPVALDSGRVWPRRSFIKRSGPVTLRISETIPPGLPRKDLEARVYEAIQRAGTGVTTPELGPHRGLFRPALELGERRHVVRTLAPHG